MKPKNILFATLLAIFTTIASAQEYSSYFSIGVPTPINSKAWSGLNLSADIGIHKEVVSNLNIGIGASYYSRYIDPERPSHTIFCFNTQVLDVFIESLYTINIFGDLSLKPGIRFGYAFAVYDLIQYKVSTKKANGFSLTPEIMLSYQVTDNIGVFAGLNFSILFAEFIPFDEGELVAIPATYIGFGYDIQYLRNLKLGLHYTF